VQRVKASVTPRDGVASLRGLQIQGILDHEFGKTFSLNGIYKLLNRHGFVCLKPRPRHPQQDPAAAKGFKRRAPFCEQSAGLPAAHQSSRLLSGRSTVRAAGNIGLGMGCQGVAARGRATERAKVHLVLRDCRSSDRVVDCQSTSRSECRNHAAVPQCGGQKSLAHVSTPFWCWAERAGTRRISSSGHDELRRCSCRHIPRN
jgi:hypothetical protein